MRMPRAASAGISVSLYSVYWRATTAFTAPARAANESPPDGVGGVDAIRCAAARTSNNSSRLDETMHR